MNYTRLLNQIIERSGLQLKEIADRCKIYGESITPSYISALKNTEGRIPSDNVSVAIAKACNFFFDDILVVQAHLDNSPESIVGLLKIIQNSGKDDWSTETPDEMQIESSLALFVCQSYLELSSNVIESMFDTTIERATNVHVKDNSMEPLIAKGSQVSVKSTPDILDGDIIAYTNKMYKSVMIRKAIMISEKKLAMVPINKEYETEILNSDEFTIIGKVYQIVNQI